MIISIEDRSAGREPTIIDLMIIMNTKITGTSFNMLNDKRCETTINFYRKIESLYIMYSNEC